MKIYLKMSTAMNSGALTLTRTKLFNVCANKRTSKLLIAVTQLTLTANLNAGRPKRTFICSYVRNKRTFDAGLRKVTARASIYFWTATAWPNVEGCALQIVLAKSAPAIHDNANATTVEFSCKASTASRCCLLRHIMKRTAKTSPKLADSPVFATHIMASEPLCCWTDLLWHEVTLSFFYRL